MANEHHCECGEATGVRCEWTGSVDETVVVEWMPPWRRENHKAAGNSGSYPANGAVRLRVHTDCAATLAEEDEKEIVVSVRADPDENDCLIAAADAYVARRPDLAGYDLLPRWEDEGRDRVLLTVPSWAAGSP